MKYTNVPLPAPLIRQIDKIVSDEDNSFRSRPDYILQHIRSIIEQDLKILEEKNAKSNPD